MCVAHPEGMGFDFIVIPPSYHFIVASLSLGMEYLSLVGSRVLLSVIVQHLVVILVLLQEEMSRILYSSILKQKPWTCSLSLVDLFLVVTHKGQVQFGFDSRSVSSIFLPVC